MKRRLALLLGLVISLVVLLPFATSTAHNLRSQYYAHSHRSHHHSRRWWRHHRALMRRRQAAIARRRALQAALRNGRPGSELKAANHVAFPNALAFPESVVRDGAFAMPLPDNWSTATVTPLGSSFQIGQSNGNPGAQASLAIVALAPSANAVTPLPNEQRKMVGGVAFTDLRHTVIDKMISADGWVVNDRQREIGGHKVFEVIAQTPANSDTKSDQVWNFYFTEVDGRVYSLTTKSGVGASTRVAADAEQFITTFKPVDPKR
jgi:hypothetical protein